MRYVGFGANTFADFRLFHKQLGIRDMVSIEQEESDGERMEFNSPYKCIKVLSGTSTDVLPSISWSKRTIAWLDYESSLDELILRDVHLVVEKAMPLSVCIVTVNARALINDQQISDGEGQKILEQIQAKDWAGRLPKGIKPEDFVGKKTAKMFRKLILAEATKALAFRNSFLPRSRHLKLQVILGFDYRDGAPMTTIGFILHTASHTRALQGCRLGNLDWTPSSPEDTFNIDPPILTPRERHLLEEQLPNRHDDQVEPQWLRNLDRGRFRHLYRFMPSYVDAEP